LTGITAAWFLIIFAFGWFSDYNYDPVTGDYSMFQDIHVMIFIGFGFLMAFLSRNSFTSTGHSLLLASFAVVWSMFNYWFWHNVIAHPRDVESWWRFRIGVDQLVNADFCAGAVLISYGAVIGRLSTLQTIVMVVFEVVFYSINESIGYKRFGVGDLGGSMIIHTFGAYFGLTVSLLLEKKEDRKKKNEITWQSTHSSDTLAMVGTLFLWCFWPSFNAYFAGPIRDGAVTQRAVVNTYLSLCSSVVAAYVVSGYLGKGKFNIVDIQNATLAGGVAMGAAANMLCMPYGALIIGFFAGSLSTFGFHVITPFLDRVIGLKDTCGVHNLHGMPGVTGAIASIILSANAKKEDYAATGYCWSAIWVFADEKNLAYKSLLGYQLGALFMTLGIAILGGVFTASVVQMMTSPEKLIYDDVECHVEDYLNAPENDGEDV
jgi:ammonium transporter Rh